MARVLGIIALTFYFTCQNVSAHMNQPVSGEKVPEWAPDRLTFMPTEHVPKLVSPPLGVPGLESVVVLPNKWSQTQTLRVCFIGGSDSLRSKIIKTGATWFQYTNLKLDAGGASGKDCAPKDASEIRIGFTEPGYWSYIGNDSIDDRLISKSLVSMNFQGFDKNPPAEPEFSGIILHEWGHALGLHHEHQSPASGCDKEYNWDKLYKFYKDTYGWSKQMTDDNVRQLTADRSAYDWSKEDSKSIMIYASDPRFLYKGTRSKCYFKENYVLSDLDKEGISKAYTPTNSRIALRLQSTTLQIVLGQGLDKRLEKALQTQFNLTQGLSPTR